MIWLVVGYMFLFIFRPFEYWQVLGHYRVERIYMLFLMAAVFFWHQKRYIPHAINRGVLAFFGVMVISSLLALNMTDAYEASFDYFKLIVFYFILILTIRDEKDLKKFVIAYIAIMFIYVGKSAWEFFVHDRYMWRMGIRRMMGVDITYGDPNSLAASIAYSLPFVWAMIKYKAENIWTRRMIWAYGALALISIIYTGSRSGMVSVLLFLFLMWLGTSRKFFGIVALGVTLLVLWNVMPLSYQLRFESIFIKDVAPSSAYESAEGRRIGFIQGVKIFKQHPVFGIGPGNFKHGWDNPSQGASAHNLYGELLGEVGGAGLLVFMILVFTIYRAHKKVIRTTTALLGQQANAPPDRKAALTLMKYIATASAQTIILLLFNGNFGHNLYRYNWLWLGALGVLALYFLQREQESPAVRFRTAAFSRHTGANAQAKQGAAARLPGTGS